MASSLPFKAVELTLEMTAMTPSKQFVANLFNMGMKEENKEEEEEGSVDLWLVK